MTTYSAPDHVNVGLTANDGTGDTLREAFIKQNDNFYKLSNFIANDPTFTSANVTFLKSSSLTSEFGNFTTGIEAVTVHTSDTITSDGNIIANNSMFLGNIAGGAATFGYIESTGDSKVVGNLVVTTDAEIHGSLTVFGNVTTITSSELVINDVAIAISAPPSGTTLSQNDNKDRGIDFHWYEGEPGLGTPQIGFFGFNNTPEINFTYEPVKGAGAGNALFDRVFSNVTSTGDSIFETTHSNTIFASNTVTSTEGFVGNLLTSAQPNVTSLGTLEYLNIGSNVVITGNSILIRGSDVATSAATFSGGTVPNWTMFADTTTSTSPNTGAVNIAGGLGVVGNVNVGSKITANSLSATEITGTLITPDQPNITNVGTLGNLVVANNITTTSLSIHNITASNFINTSILTASTGISGVVTTGDQPNIISLGTLTSLGVSGNVTAPMFIGDVIGNVSGSSSGTASTVTTPAQPAITSVGILTDLTVSGNTSVGSLNAGSGLIETTGNITSSGTVTGSFLTGTIKTPAQPNITSVGMLNSLTISGTLTTFSPATFASTILATGAGTQNIGTPTNRFGTLHSAYVNASNSVTAPQFLGAIDGVVGGTTPAQGTFTTVTANGNLTITSGGTIKFNDNTIQSTAAATAVTGIGLTFNNGNIDSNATPANLPITIVSRDASGNFAAGTITALCTSAKFADLAEMYEGDAQYEPGTVLVFGGAKEVTTTGHFADVSVAGIVSTAPAYLMNNEQVRGVAVALRGKVPCKVIGPVRKGDLLVTSATPGYVESVGKDPKYGVAVVAKSLDENLEPGAKYINAVVI